MVRMPNMDVEEEVIIMNPDSSSGSLSMHQWKRVQIDCSELEDERGGEDQEHKGKCSEKGSPYEYVPLTASQAIIHSRLTARARPL